MLRDSMNLVALSSELDALVITSNWHDTRLGEELERPPQMRWRKRNVLAVVGIHTSAEYSKFG